MTKINIIKDNNALNNAHYQAGDVLYKKGEYKEAITEFKKALEAWPTDSDSAWAIAGCYSEMGKPELAEEYYNLALENSPEEKKNDLVYNMGNALFDQMKYKEAIRLYDSIPKEHHTYKMAKSNIRAAKKKIERL